MHIDFGNVRQFVGIVHPIITPPHHLACGLRSDFRSLRNFLGAARLTAWPSLVDHDNEHIVLVEQGLRPALILQHYRWRSAVRRWVQVPCCWALVSLR